MGRLIDPGIGELWDRYTILRLKINKASRLMTTAHFEAEQYRICGLIMGDRGEFPPGSAAAVEDLARVNAALWAAEDRMAAWVAKNKKQRLVKYTDLEVVAPLGMGIWRLNRRRNDLIREINQLAGTDTGPEKL